MTVLSKFSRLTDPELANKRTFNGVPMLTAKTFGPCATSHVQPEFNPTPRGTRHHTLYLLYVRIALKASTLSIIAIKPELPPKPLFFNFYL